MKLPKHLKVVINHEEGKEPTATVTTGQKYLTYGIDYEVLRYDAWKNQTSIQLQRKDNGTKV